MFDKPQSSHVLGLDIDGFSLKGVVLSLVHGKMSFDQAFDFILETEKEKEENVKRLYIPEKKAFLENLTENNLVVSTANTQEVLVRPLELTLTKDKDIDDTLTFQIEPLLPYPVENAVADKILLSKNKEGSKLIVFCIRKDHLQKHLDQWKGLDIDPEVVSAAPQALVFFGNQFIESEKQYFIVHIGIENSLSVLVYQGKLLAAQSIPTGLNALIEIYAQEKGIEKSSAYTELFNQKLHIDPSKLSAGLKLAIDEIRMNVARTIFSLAKQLKGKEINGLIVTGPGAVVEGLPEILYSHLKKIKLTPKLDAAFGGNQHDLLKYALPIGEALSALPISKDQINFRQQEFIYPEPWKRLKQPLMQYFLLSLGIAVSLFLFGKAYVAYKEGVVRQQYLDLLAVMNKPYTPFEVEFSDKKYAQQKQVVGVTDLSLNEIKMRLSYLDKEIQSTPQTFPLQPNVPLVSDVLAWISSHPSFINKQEKADSGSMRILHFSYNMVKRPEPTKKQEKYQVKVELEFSSPTPKMAREFHDALIAPNDMVDPKGEIKWNANRDVYRTSFYLKDKTLYPTS
jgi:type IV pilus assembly protein PilM